MNDILNVKSLNEVEIQSRIYEVRGVKVMIDSDLAVLYQVNARALRQAVRRNIDKFPADFMFRLTKEESKQMISTRVSQNVIPQGYNTGGGDIFAFTEHGVLTLSSVLRSDVATRIGISLVRAFVSMRQALQRMSDSNLQIENIRKELIIQQQYIEEILRDQNDTNEEVQAQLDAISQSLNELQMKVEMKPSKRAIVKGFSSENSNK